MASPMVPPDDATSDATADHSSGESAATGSTEDWFAMSALRIALVLVGLVIVLFALGQAVGVDLLGTITDALGTQLGRWLVVAFFGLVLIVVAVRGFATYRE